MLFKTSKIKTLLSYAKDDKVGIEMFFEYLYDKGIDAVGEEYIGKTKIGRRQYHVISVSLSDGEDIEFKVGSDKKVAGIIYGDYVIKDVDEVAGSIRKYAIEIAKLSLKRQLIDIKRAKPRIEKQVKAIQSEENEKIQELKRKIEEARKIKESLEAQLEDM